MELGLPSTGLIYSHSYFPKAKSKNICIIKKNFHTGADLQICFGEIRKQKSQKQDNYNSFNAVKCL